MLLIATYHFGIVKKCAVREYPKSVIDRYLIIPRSGKHQSAERKTSFHGKVINPKESKPIFINEPWLIDPSLQWRQETGYDPAPLDDPDNIRVYIPMDICKESVLRRLSEVISRHGEASEKNEADYIYDKELFF